MSRKYEIVYIFDSALEEAQITEGLDRFHALLKNQDYPEPVTAISHWGKRTLAYPINKKEQGYYVVAQFESDQKLLSEFERAIKLDQNVLRYLVVINEGLAPVPVVAEPPRDDDEKRPSRAPVTDETAQPKSGTEDLAPAPVTDETAQPESATADGEPETQPEVTA